MKIIKWLLATLTLASTIIMLFVFPDTIPVHFDIHGVADRWGSKYEMLVLPIMSIVCLFVFEGISRLYTSRLRKEISDKQKSEIRSNLSVLKIITWVILILFLIMNAFFLYTSYSQVYPEKDLPEFDVIRAVCITMGIVFIIMGNYMPKTRRNSTIGFRLPWTLYNDTTWNKSNRFASYVMMITGAIISISALFTKGITAPIVMITLVLISIVIMSVYAYSVYRVERKKENE